MASHSLPPRDSPGPPRSIPRSKSTSSQHFSFVRPGSFVHQATLHPSRIPTPSPRSRFIRPNHRLCPRGAVPSIEFVQRGGGFIGQGSGYSRPAPRGVVFLAVLFVATTGVGDPVPEINQRLEVSDVLIPRIPKLR